MRSVRNIIPGIGSILTGPKSHQSALLRAMAELRDTSEVLIFGSSEGWRRFKKEILTALASDRAYILKLCRDDAKKHTEAIQRSSDLVAATEMVLNTMNELIMKHEEAENTYRKLNTEGQKLPERAAS